jgi:YfiH family protein
MARLTWLEHGFGTLRAAVPEPLATLDQVHSAVCVDACGRAGKLGRGDALLSNVPGTLVGVRTADCLPILLADERRRAVAAVHAGWRGTVAGIAARAVEAMHERFGTRPEDLHAAIGPGIGACCYEVGPEVAAHFGVEGRAKIDLAGANRQQLAAAGLGEDRIYVCGLCTMCLAAEFHSFRRDGERAGRMYSVIGVV